MNKILVLVGSQSLGDTLCAIPMIKHLSEIYDKKIHVFTYQPDLFKNCPYVILSDNYDVDETDVLVESFKVDKFVHTRTNIIQLHSLSAGFQLLPEEMKIDFYPDEYEPIENLPENYIVLHTAKTWPSRTWEKERWQELIDRLNSINIPVVIIGKNSSEQGTYHITKPVYELNIKNGLDLTNKIGIHQTWNILNKSTLIVTMDSGILHLAATTDTHIIQLGSSIDPRFRAPYRNGTQTYKYSYILGGCDIFCASNMKYCIRYNGKYNVMPPVAFCLERPETIGQDIDPDPNLYQCHPTVEQVFREITNNYKISNIGKIVLK